MFSYSRYYLRDLHRQIVLIAAYEVFVLDVQAGIYAAQRIGYKYSCQQKTYEKQFFYQRIIYYLFESSGQRW